MEFEKPSQQGFTIYSKSGCLNCLIIKKLIKEKNLLFNVVDCDEYIIEDKEKFLFFIKEETKREIKQFPIIFYQGAFIGGYNEAKQYIDKLLLSFEENFNY